MKKFSVVSVALHIYSIKVTVCCFSKFVPAVQYRTAIITRGAGALHPETPVARLLKGTPEKGLVLVELHERDLKV